MAKLKLFQWRGIDRFQQKQRGMIVAESEAMAQQQLISQGFQRLKLQQNWQLSHQPKSAEICALLTQLATLLQSAVPLKNCLHILLQNCTNLGLNQWLRKLIRDLESGLPFSQSIEQQNVYLTYQERQLIKVGEMTGKLPEVCAQIAAHKQQALALQRKIQKILLYPVLVLAISLILTILLLLFIVPQFAEMYQGNNATLPTFTQILLNLSGTLQQHGGKLLLFCIGLAFLWQRQLKHTFLVQTYKNRLVESLPLFGNITRLSRLIRFCRSLHLMLKTGVPLNMALQSFLPVQKSWQTSTKIQGDLVLQQEVERALHWLQQGYVFSACVSGRLFPTQAQQMLQVGEQSGQLSQMLHFIADSYQQQLDHQVDMLSQMLEPLLMLIIGGLIGMIMLGMYLPIFNMGALVQ